MGMSSSLLLLVCVRSLIFRWTYKELQLLNILTFFYLLNQCITVIDTVSENKHNKLKHPLKSRLEAPIQQEALSNRRNAARKKRSRHRKWTVKLRASSFPPVCISSATRFHVQQTEEFLRRASGTWETLWPSTRPGCSNRSAVNASCRAKCASCRRIATFQSSARLNEKKY